METGGVETGINVKINLMFLVSKFMASYSYKFDEVLNLNWFVFNDLLDGLRGVRIEKETQKLNLFINELAVEKSKEVKNAFDNLMDSKKTEFKSYTEYDTSERDIKEMEATLLNRSERGK